MAEPVNVVLIVEDNEVNSELTAKILNHMNLRSVVKSNGEDALAWCQEQVPMLILMDISLPGMDGLEVTRQLRELPGFEELPILALTAHAFGGWNEKTRLAGCTDYLSKPITPRQLMDHIRRHLPEAGMVPPKQSETVE